MKIEVFEDGIICKFSFVLVVVIQRLNELCTTGIILNLNFQGQGWYM